MLALTVSARRSPLLADTRCPIELMEDLDPEAARAIVD